MTSEALMRFLDEHGFEGYTFTTPDVLAVTQPGSHIEEALELFVDRLLSYDPAELSMMAKTKVADLMANTIETYEVQENTLLTPDQTEQLLADFADIFVHVRTHAVTNYETMMEEAAASAPRNRPLGLPGPDERIHPPRCSNTTGSTSPASIYADIYDSKR